MIAGTKHDQGYRQIIIYRTHYFCHRLAWLYCTGRWPKNELDHIDNNRGNDRFVNLREATSQQNKRNSRSRKKMGGMKGTTIDRETGHWIARIRNAEGKRIHLGVFNTESDAHDAYCKAAAMFHKQFARAA
jgi:hypothetical protein